MMTKEQLLQIGREYGRKGATQLSEELGISRQRIQQLATKLRKAGAPIPNLRDKRARQQEIEEVVEQLKREL